MESKIFFDITLHSTPLSILQDTSLPLRCTCSIYFLTSCWCILSVGEVTIIPILSWVKFSFSSVCSKLPQLHIPHHLLPVYIYIFWSAHFWKVVFPVTISTSFTICRTLSFLMNLATISTLSYLFEVSDLNWNLVEIIFSFSELEN